MNSARKIQVGILCLVAFALLFGAFGRVSTPSATAAAATTGGLNGGGTNGQTIPPHYEIDWTGTSGVRNSGPAPTLTQYWDNPEHVASNYSNQSSEGAGIFTGGMHGPAIGTADTSGTFDVVLTWNGDEGNEEPYQLVLIREIATADWSGDSGSADCGISPATTGGDTYSGSETATRYTVIDEDTDSIPLSISPSASAALGSGSSSSLMAGDASVGYSVAAFPMRIVLQGITETEEGDALMIGQQIIATVEMLNVPSGATPTFEWTVTGDGKFKSYKIVNGEQDPNDEENLIFSATYLGEDTIDFHSASVELTFAEPGSAEFSCEIDLGLAGLEPFTISRPLLVLAPFSPDIHTEGGYVHDTGVSLRASEVQITIPDTPTYLWRGVTTSLFGIVWTSQAMTPEPMWKSSGSDYDRGAVSFAILAEKRHWEWNTPSASGVEAPSNFSAPTPESRKIYVGFQYNTLTSDGILPIDPQFLEMEAERPGISTGDKIWVAFEEVFMAYFMYLPPAHGLPRYWVPLSRQGVTVDFTANKSGSTFAISGEEVYVGSTGPYPSHPVWTSMVGRDP